MRSALTAANGFANLKTNVKSRTATFTSSSKINFKKKLEEIAAKNKHVKGFEIQKGAKAEKKDGQEGRGKKAKGLTVSLKLPNMT